MDKISLLQHYFGYGEFRPGQEELVDGILNGRDVFGIMPTGGGKSICYQLPGLMLPGGRAHRPERRRGWSCGRPRRPCSSASHR